MKNRKGASVIILAFSVITLLGLTSFALDMGLVLNQRYELQKAVESAALISASEFEAYESSDDFDIPTASQISDPSTGNAGLHYKALMDTNQMLTGLSVTPTVTLNIPSKAVRVEATAEVPTYFLQLLGVKKVSIQAAAAAVNKPAYLSSQRPAPTGSVLLGSGAYSDTEIKQPLGSVAPGTTTIPNNNSQVDSIFGEPDGKVLSLGPGGHITIKLPATLVDGKGFDFAVYERGHAEGYFIYAGIDADQSNPYIDASNPGSGILWINISCTGTPLYVNKNELIGAHRTTVSINGTNRTEYKFYGSGLFDLGTECQNAVDGTIYDGNGTSAPRISNVKYLKIIDDNREDGFLLQPKYGITSPSAVPMLIPGEHSTFTPGADLDAVEILHHSRLISLSAFTADSDGDGLLDIVEDMYGFNAASPDSDGDGISDMDELWGYNTATNNTLQSGGAPVLFKDYPTWTEVPPVMEITP